MCISFIMNDSSKLIETANLLLDISSLLMVSGANTNRANLSIDRFASVLNCKAYSLISHKTIIMTLTDEENDESCTRVQNIPPYIINFSVISAVSKASWNAISENWTLEQIEISEKELIQNNGKTGLFKYNHYVGKNLITDGVWGGGDYFGYNQELCGTWARDVISIEETYPEDYTELVCDFS